MAKPAFTVEQAKILRLRYENGEDTVKLAKEHGVGDSCIATWIRKAGGTLRTNSQSKRKFSFNEEFFVKIDTELKAYWLGFLLADGYIGKYGGKWRNLWCTLSAKDANHLQLFMNHIGSDYPVAVYQRANHRKARICLTSMAAVGDLVRKKWCEFKSEGNCHIMKYVPDHLFNHFVRGYFDGDGSIVRKVRQDRHSKAYQYSFVLVAHANHHNFLDAIRAKMVVATGVKDKALKRRGSVWVCHWNGNAQVGSLCQWLYSNASAWLPRKRERYEELLGGKLDFIWPRDNRFKFLLKPKQIVELPDSERDRIIDRFCELATNSKWIAPSYTGDELVADWRAVQIYDSKLYCRYEDGRLVGFRTNSGGSLPAPGKQIVQHYQPHFWSVDTSQLSIATRWNNAKMIRRAAKALLTTGTRITLERYIREMRYAGAGVTSHFHPNFATAIVNSLCPNCKSWFDPSMGWGGRLMAARLLDISYEGCDPQPDTHVGLNKIAEFVGSSATLHQMKAQDYQFTRRFDLGFTSPPFFNKERYGGTEQSYFEFNRYDSWVTGFLCPLVDKMRSNCDMVILHVDQRIRDSLARLYQLVEYPVALQRNPGSRIGYEYVVHVK
jgi:DNA-binding transcriptional regulator WhiA